MEINSVQSNPIYKDPIGPGSPFDSQMPGEEDDDEGMPPPSYNSAMGRGGWVSVVHRPWHRDASSGFLRYVLVRSVRGHS